MLVTRKKDENLLTTSLRNTKNQYRQPMWMENALWAFDEAAEYT